MEQWQGATGGWAGAGQPVVNAGMPTVVGRADYAANGGDTFTQPEWSPNPSGPNGGPVSISQVENPPGVQTANAITNFAVVAQSATGVHYLGSLIKMADITDGTSNTYLVGEKYLDSDYYATGQDGGDNEDAMMGENADISRWSSNHYPFQSPADWWPPTPDTPGLFNYWAFGRRHNNGFFMAFCDGSVHLMSYMTAPPIHCCLANRKDGQPIDGNQF